VPGRGNFTNVEKCIDEGSETNTSTIDGGVWEFNKNKPSCNFRVEAFSVSAGAVNSGVGMGKLIVGVLGLSALFLGGL